MELHIKKLHQDAYIPVYAHDGDAGMDMCALEETIAPVGQRISVPTGISMAIPDGHVGLVWEKSGLAFKHGIKTFGGVIDSGYRGEVMIGLINTSNTEYVFRKGDKVAQILIQKVEHPRIVEVLELDNTERGEDGFGSTGN